MELVLQVYDEENVVMKTIAEIDFPEEHKWAYTGLKVKDLSVYNKDSQIIFFIRDN